MKSLLTQNGLTVIRESTDKKYYNDSLLLNDIKKHLIKDQQMDVIKKLAWKDGHMVSDNVHYIRDRKWGFCFFDWQYAIRFLYSEWNQENKIYLTKEDWRK